MGAFVSKTPVRVTLPSRPDEYIAIVPKLAAGARADLHNRLLSVKLNEDAAGEDKADLAFNAGLYNQLLLEAAIVGWRLQGDPDCGLELDAEGYVKFKHEHIGQLDLDDELVDAALGEIAKRNPLSAKQPGKSANG